MLPDACTAVKQQAVPNRAIAFGFLEAPLKGKLLLPTADLGDSVPLLQDVKANKPENTAGNYKCRPRKFQMRLPCCSKQGNRILTLARLR